MSLAVLMTFSGGLSTTGSAGVLGPGSGLISPLATPLAMPLVIPLAMPLGTPLPGMVILVPSGELGTILGSSPGMWMRFASF